MNRRRFLHHTIAFAAAPTLLAQTTPAPLTSRPPIEARRFTSPAIEAAIAALQPRIADPELFRIFANCLPNTLDTTVFPSAPNTPPDTYIITGDIDAMWLRDSSAQLFPYVPFAAHDPALARLITGAIHRLTRNILLDPYANAFTREVTSPALPWALHDRTLMRPGVAERKWEIDSLCYPIRLAHHLWKSTGNTAPFDANWLLAARLILQTFRQQQRLHSPGPYSFQRSAETPTDTLPLNGFGNPALPNGLIRSAFRPSDDATLFPYLIPSNLFAIATLHHIAEIASTLYNDPTFASDCTALAATVQAAVNAHGIIQHPTFGRIYAYEVDGFGGVNLMDDANAPSLLSLGYLIPALASTPLYRASRAFALSPANPYFFEGTAAVGIGGPHIGLHYIWPMSIILRALTSTSEPEIRLCLRTLRDTTANTHFMHESFHSNNPADFTRPWFAWANTLFGELILTLNTTHPHLLQQPL